MTVTPTLPKDTPIASFLESFVAHAVSVDDVFREEFLDGILICVEDPSKLINIETAAVEKTWNSSWVRFIDAGDAPSPGPYVLDGGMLSLVCRVYEDTADAFSLALQRDRAEDKRYCIMISPCQN